VLKLLAELAENAPQKYVTFWHQFDTVRRHSSIRAARSRISSGPAKSGRQGRRLPSPEQVGGPGHVLIALIRQDHPAGHGTAPADTRRSARSQAAR
jgi:hypothetical protein